MVEEKMFQIIEKAIKDKVFPGCTLGWIKDGERKVYAFGKHTYEENSINVNTDTIYDVASITKSIPTSTILLMLIEKGLLSLGDPVYKFIPEFANFENKKEVKIIHILNYTLNLIVPSMTSLKDKNPKDLINIVMKAELREKPGINHLYTNSTAGIMSVIIEKVIGRRLDDISQEYLFDKLEMNRSTFYPLKKFSKDQIAPTEIDEWRGGLLQGVVHDESSWVLEKKGPTGVAGLFSTTPDLLNFCEMILNNGFYKENKILSLETIQEIFKNQIIDSKQSFGLGWEMNDSSFMGKFSSGDMIGKRGYTGCLVLLDLKKEIAMVLLSNRVFPKRPENGEAINQVRRDLADILFEV
jgi:CubicO group peptidase (beta-lactamase class C family)